MTEKITDYFAICAANFAAVKEEAPVISQAAGLLIDSLRSGGKVMFCGKETRRND